MRVRLQWDSRRKKQYWVKFCLECGRLANQRSWAKRSKYKKSKYCPRRHALKYWVYRERWDKKQGKYYLTRMCKKCQTIASIEHRKFNRILDATT